MGRTSSNAFFASVPVIIEENIWLLKFIWNLRYMVVKGRDNGSHGHYHLQCWCEHTDEILAEIGYSAEKISGLKENKAV